MTFALLLATVLAGDSIVYPVMNHERVAGSMVVSHSGDTTTVRFVFTDRNRTRNFVRYVSRNGRIVSTELHSVLPNDLVGDPTFRLEFFGDSVRQWSPQRTSTEAARPGAYYALNSTPYDQATLAKYLLRQPSKSTFTAQGDTARAEVLKTLSVRTARETENVKLVAISRGF